MQKPGDRAPAFYSYPADDTSVGTVDACEVRRKYGKGRIGTVFGNVKLKGHAAQALEALR